MKGIVGTSEKEVEILSLIHSRVGLSRVDLANLTGLSGASISCVVRRFINKKLVVESGLEAIKLGRPRVVLSLSAGIAYAVGGNHHISAWGCGPANLF